MKWLTATTFLAAFVVAAQIVIIINTIRITRLGQDRWTGTDMKRWVESLGIDNPGLVVREPVHED